MLKNLKAHYRQNSIDLNCNYQDLDKSKDDNPYEMLQSENISQLISNKKGDLYHKKYVSSITSPIKSVLSIRKEALHKTRILKVAPIQRTKIKVKQNVPFKNQIYQSTMKRKREIKNWIKYNIIIGIYYLLQRLKIKQQKQSPKNAQKNAEEKQSSKQNIKKQINKINAILLSIFQQSKNHHENKQKSPDIIQEISKKICSKTQSIRQKIIFYDKKKEKLQKKKYTKTIQFQLITEQKLLKNKMDQSKLQIHKLKQLKKCQQIKLSDEKCKKMKQSIINLNAIMRLLQRPIIAKKQNKFIQECLSKHASKRLKTQQTQQYKLALKLNTQRLQIVNSLVGHIQSINHKKSFLYNENVLKQIHSLNIQHLLQKQQGEEIVFNKMKGLKNFLMKLNIGSQQFNLNQYSHKLIESSQNTQSKFISRKVIQMKYRSSIQSHLVKTEEFKFDQIKKSTNFQIENDKNLKGTLKIIKENKKRKIVSSNFKKLAFQGRQYQEQQQCVLNQPEKISTKVHFKEFYNKSRSKPQKSHRRQQQPIKSNYHRADIMKSNKSLKKSNKSCIKKLNFTINTIQHEEQGDRNGPDQLANITIKTFHYLPNDKSVHSFTSMKFYSCSQTSIKILCRSRKKITSIRRYRHKIFKIKKRFNEKLFEQQIPKMQQQVANVKIQGISGTSIQELIKDKQKSSTSLFQDLTQKQLQNCIQQQTNKPILEGKREVQKIIKAKNSTTTHRKIKRCSTNIQYPNETSNLIRQFLSRIYEIYRDGKIHDKKGFLLQQINNIYESKAITPQQYQKYLSILNSQPSFPKKHQKISRTQFISQQFQQPQNNQKASPFYKDLLQIKKYISNNHQLNQVNKYYYNQAIFKNQFEQIQLTMAKNIDDDQLFTIKTIHLKHQVRPIEKIDQWGAKNLQEKAWKLDVLLQKDL